MKKRQKLLTRRAVGVDRPLFPEPKRRRGQAGPSGGAEPRLFRGHSVGAADRCGVALSARRVSFAFDLLAAAEAVGRGRGLAGCLAELCWGRWTKRVY